MEVMLSPEERTGSVALFMFSGRGEGQNFLKPELHDRLRELTGEA